MKILIFLLICYTLHAEPRYSEYFHRKDRKWVRVIGTEEQFKRAHLATTGLGPRGIYTEQGFRLRWPHARIARTKYLH